MKKTIEIYYDGECPYCKSYKKIIDIRKRGFKVIINDAREHVSKIKSFRKLGIEIEDGIILKFDTSIYQGAEAIKIIDSLTEKKSFKAKFYSLIIGLPFFKDILYPIVKKIRLFTLRIMGISKI